MNRLILAALATALGFLAGCSLFRWSGYRDPGSVAAGTWSAVELVVSTGPARSRLPPLPVPERLPQTLYYADLGPDAIDVSAYPIQQRYNYGIFQRQCSRCHTLARAVNSPVQSRAYWSFHLVRMSVHSRIKHAGPIPAGEMKAVLDFLEHDARVRKVEDKNRFEELTRTLKRRFDPVLEDLTERMR